MERKKSDFQSFGRSTTRLAPNKFPLQKSKTHKKALSMLDPLSKKQNFPIPTIPPRKSQPPLRPIVPKLDLKARKDSIVTTLLQSNSERRLYLDAKGRQGGIPMIPALKPVEKEDRVLNSYRRSSSCIKDVKVASPDPRQFAESTFRLAIQRVESTTAPQRVNKKERTRKALSALKHFIQLGLPSYYIPKLKLFVPDRPFAGKHSLKFLMSCRVGDNDSVQQYLLSNRWLSLEFDKVRKTGLHWAARRDHVEIIDSLLKAGAFIDARDCIGRTPLFLAARAGNIEAVRMLLAKKANPFLKTFGNKAPMSVAKDPAIRKLLIRSMQLSILMKFAAVSQRHGVWEREGLAFFSAELAVIHDS